MDASPLNFLNVENSLTVINNPKKYGQPYHDRVLRAPKFKTNLENIWIDANKLWKYGLFKNTFDKSYNSLKTSINAT